MSKFENRESSTLNYKILDVKSVERDESGEIISMEVEVIRNDTPKEGKEGTPLNAESLNTIIKEMINEAIGNTMDYVFTTNEKLYKDLKNISLPEKTIVNFELPQVGELKTIFQWSVPANSGIEIENSIAKIQRKNEEQIVTLTVVASNGEDEDTKEFVIIVPGVNIPEDVETENHSVSVFPDGSSAGVRTIYTTAKDNSVFVVENEYSEYFSVTPVRQGDQVCITIYAGTCPLEGGTGEVTCRVRVDDATDGVTSKLINITVEFTDSVEGED